MEISIIQCTLIGLWTAFCLSGMLLGIYTNRCIILSFGVGIILGDIPTGLAMGAVGELAFMGFGVGAGGTVPPNPMGPGIVGTIMAITMKGAGMDTATALALSFPFAVAFQFLITATYTFATGLTSYAKKGLDKKKFGQFRVAANATVVVFAVVGFIIGFAGAYSAEGLKMVIELIPAWLITGLSVAGKMLPAVGFAMILTVMAKKELIPFVLLGYIAVAYLQLPVMGVAFVGTMFALMEFYRTKGNGNSNDGNDDEEVVFEDGI
ncbi:PTS mannose/fructose/sorbose/N-acetylgalactosamine transporter subunit IIC [Clostridium sp. Ade.TY]|uniref:PTS mannose/fructose/sorbose/N-acetylgalactosamine transporter subunit IIC n=1 Tax=Clostridium sp. Ade.TY TaxID=1391647 RepID=UPI0004196BA5|nr:PTS mannose/fructose/sorbose/N-acetylgalactosamine transporter subunit IIC [Clostridium sp. Ade.TY]